MTDLNFNVDQTTSDIVFKIMARFAARVDLGRDRLGLVMDLTACHNGPCPLALSELLAADDIDFFHDVAGIYRHFNRVTGDLDDAFMPRYARCYHPLTRAS
jgi:hypothetical protein